MKQAEFDIVYRRLESYSINKGGGDREGLPTVEVRNGTVEVYISNNPVEPIDQSSMTLSDTLQSGVFTLEGVTGWILFTVSVGNPEVYCFGVI